MKSKLFGTRYNQITEGAKWYKRFKYGSDPILKDKDSVSADDIAIELYNKTVLE